MSPSRAEEFANCRKFARARLDKFAAIFRIALMGADENAERSEDVQAVNVSESIKEKLDRGWELREQQDGQLLLIPPPRYGDVA